MNESGQFNTLSLAETAIFATAISVVMLVELLGNIMVLCVLYRQRTKIKQRVTNTLLANLAFIDLLVATILSPFSIAVIIEGRKVLTFHLCQTNGFVNNLVGSASILTMAVIGVDRYRAIVSPPGHRLRSKHALLLLLCVWIVSLLISLLPIMFWGEYQPTEKSTTCKSERGSYLLLQAMLCFVIPLAIMMYCYAKVFLKVRGHRITMKNSWKRNSSNIKTEFKTTKVVMIVLTVFILAWSPFVIVYLLSSNVQGANIPPAVFQFCGFLAGAHSMCNPIIYFTMNRYFRRDAISCVPFLRSCFPTVASMEETERSSNATSGEKANNSHVLRTLPRDNTLNRKLTDNLEIIATNENSESKEKQVA